MKRLTSLLVTLLVPAFVLAGVTASPAMAQEKGKAIPKVLLDNDKVRVFEIQFKPGDENTSVPSSSFRVVRAVKGGTLMRNYVGGKTEKIEWKTGEVRLNEPSKVAYTAKNIGKTDIELYVVVLK
jgi:hypothetical protein